MSGAFEVRFCGRGGQGIVTAAELLSVAAFLEGREAQAFPSFGSERMGAPVTSFCRIAERPIRTHEPVAEPDVVVVADSTLLWQVDVFGGLQPGGWALVDSVRPPGELGLSELAGRLPPGHVRTVAASELARTHLGRPLPNVCLLGALAALTGVVCRDSLHAAVSERFPGPLAQGNLAALDAAFAQLTVIA